ncbi:hypothetical protein RND71_008357 [Anisodus tanguticus]|uniref:CTLH domain-containing protein n=1 Tax=Anisodus tanguticus TaxID=243964 RepID=A0AAE1SKN5_9SOLA|nr:hypothetical protein RND71_008357 [Anisodus tanguticus]
MRSRGQIPNKKTLGDFFPRVLALVDRVIRYVPVVGGGGDRLVEVSLEASNPLPWVLVFIIEGAEDDEPPFKRVKVSSGKPGDLSKSTFLRDPASCSLNDLMARPLVCQGDDEVVCTKGVVKKVEFVRIIAEALYSLGYNKAGARLEEESGIPMQSSVVKLFMQQILDGKWDESVVTLHKIGLMDENIVKMASFVILEQKFFELLDGNNVMDALKTLRTEIGPLCINNDRVCELSLCILSPPQRVFAGMSGQDVVRAKSRTKLLEELQKLLPPTVIIPEQRLVHLVEQALDLQLDSCRFHNSLVGEMSLLTDHQCGRDQIPSQTLQGFRAFAVALGSHHYVSKWLDDLDLVKTYSSSFVVEHFSRYTIIALKGLGVGDIRVDPKLDAKDGVLGLPRWGGVWWLFRVVVLGNGQAFLWGCHGWVEGHGDVRDLILQDHSDEVWFLQFSHDGKYLASSAADCLVIIWGVKLDGLFCVKHRFSGHQKPVSYMSWSPDDHQLLTCGVEEVVRRWDVESGECIHIYEKNGLGLISCGWAPDGKRILCGVTDKSISMWDLQGKELECWKGRRTIRISDLGITSDGKHVVSVCKDNMILLFGWESKAEKVIQEDQTITSFVLSTDNKYLLVSLLNQEIHLWDIEGTVKLISKYNGHKRSRFVLRSCFGGLDQAFIASGSEDSQVYIWHKSSGEFVETLAGHSGTVNCVSWNPVDPHMLASASDDHTIRIWGLNQVNMKHNGTVSNGVHYCNGGT